MAQTINADDGVISGSAGLKSSSDGTAILSLQTKGTTALTVDGSQNVVVNGATASYSASNRGNITIAGTSATILGFQVGGTAYGYLFHDGINVQLWNERNGAMFFGTNAIERMRLDASGNLGVGTTSPGYKLDVRGVTASGNGTITTGFTYDTRGLVGTFSNHALGFITNGSSPTMVLDTSGNLGVGTTSPKGRLHTDISTADTPALIVTRDAFTGSYNGGRIRLGTYDSNLYGAEIYGIQTSFADNMGIGFAVEKPSVGRVEAARITSGGNLLVGTTSSSAVADPGVKIIPEFNGANSPGLSIVTSPSSNSTSSILLYSTGAGAYRFYVGDGGTIYATNTTISAISDQRFKENISDLDIGLDAVMALKPRKFDWKAGKGKDIKNDRGFIAQEFEQVFPDLIDEWKDPAPEGEESYKSVRQDLIPVLVKAIQEQQAMIKALEAKVAALESK